MVAPPLIRYLAQRGVALTVAGDDPQRARRLLDESGARDGRCVAWSFGDESTLVGLIGAHRVVVSLLPAPMHPAVARCCVEQRRHLVTTSYLSEPMRALDAAASEADVTLLNEMGVDPGIDHMTAMAMFDSAREQGLTVCGFRSCCGGIPAPSANDNPWGYKFSWSPLGALRAATRPARFVDDAATVAVAAGRLSSALRALSQPQLGELEAFPNGDALPYAERYGLTAPETLYRGTLRYPGWAETTDALYACGLLADAQLSGARWDEQLARCAGADDRHRLSDRLTERFGSRVVERLRWLGLLEATPVAPAPTVIEALAALMVERMSYRPDECDALVMRHELGLRAAGSGDPLRWRAATLTVLGEPGGDSAMARTVGLPAAIGARLLLDGAISARGIALPEAAEIYRPVLDELAEHGIAMSEPVGLTGQRGSQRTGNRSG